MRVVSGFLGGRIFDSPKGHRTHPMSEKTRGALFGALGDIKGLTVLDAFAGSGALAIEAISRGAAHAVSVDVDKSAYIVILRNIEKLDLKDRIKPIRANVSAWSNRHPNQKFDLVLIDPPFDNINYKIIRKIGRHLAGNGVMAINLPGKHEPLTLEGMQIAQSKNYGDSKIIFYKISQN